MSFIAREQKRCFVHEVAHDFRRRLAAGNEIYRLASPQWHRGHIARGEHRRREHLPAQHWTAAALVDVVKIRADHFVGGATSRFNGGPQHAVRRIGPSNVEQFSHLGAFRARLHQQYPVGKPEWWHDIVEGLPDPIVKDGFIQVDAWTRRGMGLDFNVEAARPYLKPENADFFD